jgi:drug/metabolite transporter (DMT)-like permease
MEGVTYPRWPAVHPYVLLTFAALFWAGNVVLGRAVSGAIPPVTLNVLRWGIALALLLPIAWPQLAGKGQVVRKHLAELVSLAVPSTALYNTFIYIGTRTTTATNAGLIVGTMPIAISVLGYLAGEDRLTTRRLAGIAISFAGVVLVIAKGSSALVRELSLSSGGISSSERSSPGPPIPSSCAAFPYLWAAPLCWLSCRQSGWHCAPHSALGSFCMASASSGRPERRQRSSMWAFSPP